MCKILLLVTVLVRPLLTHRFDSLILTTILVLVTVALLLAVCPAMKCMDCIQSKCLGQVKTSLIDSTLMRGGKKKKKPTKNS